MVWPVATISAIKLWISCLDQPMAWCWVATHAQNYLDNWPIFRILTERAICRIPLKKGRTKTSLGTRTFIFTRSIAGQQRRVNWGLSSFRLIIMRIRFWASDLGLDAKINLIGAKSKQASCADMVLGSFVFLLVWFSSWVFGLRKLKPTSTTATSGAAPSALRSALDSSIQAYAQTLVWPRRDVPTRFTWCFFSTKHPSPARELLLLCVLSHDS